MGPVTYQPVLIRLRYVEMPWYLYNAVRYETVNYLNIPSNRHPIACQYCKCKAWFVFYLSYHSVMISTSYCIGPHCNGTWMYYYLSLKFCPITTRWGQFGGNLKWCWCFGDGISKIPSVRSVIYLSHIRVLRWWIFSQAGNKTDVAG